jgi:hypothetical protein
MGVLLLLSLIVLVRALFVKEKGVIILLLSLLVLGEISGAVIA